MELIGAVITGDIVNSTKYSIETRKNIRDCIHTISKELLQDDAYSHIIPFPIHIFSGDSWQVLVTSPQKALRVGLLIRAGLRARMELPGLDTRFGIGIGEIVQGKGGISFGDGEAFILSGRSLTGSGKKKNPNMVISLSERLSISPMIADSLNSIFDLIDFIASNWTGKQALAVAGALNGRNSNDIASHWVDGGKISRRMVNEHLNKAGWDSIQSGIAFFEENIPDISESAKVDPRSTEANQLPI